MIKKIITFCLSIVTLTASAQECDCLSQLNEVVSHFEANNPAFQKIKKDLENYKKYTSNLKKIRAKAKLNKRDEYCITYLDQYVQLLKDHHSSIGYNLKRDDLSTPELIAQFRASEDYLRFKKVAIDTSEIMSRLRPMSTKAIEGIYSNGGNIVFGIIKKEGTPNEYFGIVLKSNKLLNVGHVLMELTNTKDNMFEIRYNIGLLGFKPRIIFKKIAVENGQLSDFGFYKAPKADRNTTVYEFKSINDSVNYVRLSSFDQKLTDELNRFYDEKENEIREKPYLIIDLRNNGGGSESSYFKLLPYLYTQPLKIDNALVWVTPENIKRYEEAASKNRLLISRMKLAKPYSYIDQVENAENTWTLDSVSKYPRKVVLLFNKGTASAAEGMILYGVQSDKVITMGENSGGYLGYGNVMTTLTNCGYYAMLSTTTQYSEKSKYEFIGIPPMVTLGKNQDWIELAVKQLQSP